MNSEGLRLIVYDDPVSMEEALAPWLEERAALNNLLLGLLYRMARRHRAGHPVEAHLVAVWHHDRPCLAFLQMPGRWETAMVADEDPPDAAVKLAVVHFAAQPDPMQGLVGTEPQASAFAQRYSRHFTIQFRQQVWQLDRLVAPRPAAGGMRLARPDDAEQLEGWMIAFFAEALHKPLRQEEARALVRGKVLERSFYVWDDGGVVAVAGLERPTRSGITVVLVYTPESARGRGYASNLVAEMSAKAFTDGYRFLCLHTDADFPTSNKIYAQLGYYIVGSGSIIRFGE